MRKIVEPCGSRSAVNAGRVLLAFCPQDIRHRVVIVSALAVRCRGISHRISERSSKVLEKRSIGQSKVARGWWCFAGNGNSFELRGFGGAALPVERRIRRLRGHIKSVMSMRHAGSRGRGSRVC